MSTARTATFPIEPLILNRWSPRALNGESISHEELMSLFEAARWAPSAYNNQPWRFVYAKRDTEQWKTFFELLVEFNQGWAHAASALVVVLSKKIFDHNGELSITNQFDTGAAWENLALEASARGLVAHGMQGFDYEKARIALNVPDEFDVLAMIAIGKPGSKENLTPDLQERETPSDRKSLNEIAMEGIYQEYYF